MNINKKFNIGLVLLSLLFTFSLKAQISITAGHTAQDMAQMLAGSGITITNAQYTGSCDSSTMAGKFQVTAATPFGLADSGIILTSGDVLNAVGPSAVPSTSYQLAGDPDLATLASPQTSNDACILEFDLIPTGDTIKFKYVFGSAEYQTYSCSIADVFGFFISGPGITGPFANNSKNIALLPNGCYVGVNTVNGQTSNPCGNASGTCAPPNNGLFFNNLPTGNTLTGIAYNGFTLPLFAVTAVQPCSTYHLKLAISDASDWILDSGVFLEAGSLSSNSISFQTSTTLANPEPYVVEGCAIGSILVSRPVATPFPYTVNYLVGGTAINGIDYQPIGNSVTILANQTTALVPIIAITDGIAEGKETVVLYRQAQCDTAVIDSAIVAIYDSLQFRIITPDTSICLYDTINILVEKDSLLNIIWTNIPYINSTTATSPIVSPVNTVTYTATVSLPLAGCVDVTDQIVVTINYQPTVDIGPDITVCKNAIHNFAPNISPQQNYTYEWTPATFLNNPALLNPTATFTAVGTYTYVLKVTPTAQGCSGYDTIIVEVLPNDITINTPDTIVCEGASFLLRATGHPKFTYLWTADTYLSNAFTANTVCTPLADITYNLTASYPGCPNMIKSVAVSVQPVAKVNLGPDRSVCLYDTLQLEAMITPSNYPNYTFAWSPSQGLSATNKPRIIFDSLVGNSYILNVTTPIGCRGIDTINVTVLPGDFLSLSPNYVSVCPNATLNPVVNGAASYVWRPPFYMADSTLGNPSISPVTSVVYQIIGTSNFGCLDTAEYEIYVANSGLIDAGPDVTLYPGDNFQFTPTTNCVTFNWSPSTYLNATNISNPTITNPLVSQQYIVNGLSDFGCPATDTVIVSISPSSKLAMPNVFTPGSGTSANDQFKIDRLGIAVLNDFKIFNRWGEMVFESKDINKGWDGRLKGVPQPMGTYVFFVDAVDTSGKKFTKQGNVTLIR
jgi:gliding motility-associated-like protein